MSDLILTHPLPKSKKPLKDLKPTCNKPVSTCPVRFLKIPSIVIHPDNVILYSKLEYLPGCSPNRNYVHLQSSSRSHHNVLSVAAKRKLQKAIKYLIFLAHDKKVYNPIKKKSFNYKVGFITLTLSSAQIHNDRTITEQLLHQFLVEAKQKWKITRYVWKAEYQRNGNIHYHILVDRYIPYQELRNCWNRIQNKLGYVDRAIYKNSNYSYNSTDIHSLYNVNDITQYVSKYMSKSFSRQRLQISRKEFNILHYDYEEIAALTNQIILGISVYDDNDTYYYTQSLFKQRKSLKSVSKGAKEFLKTMLCNFRIWGCSYDLSNIKGYSNELESAYKEELEKMRNSQSVKVYDKDTYSIFYIKNGYLSQKEYPLLFNHFHKYVSNTFTNSSKQLILEEFT